MRYGHRHHLEECAGRKRFAKSVAKTSRDQEEVDCVDASFSNDRKKNKKRSGKVHLRYRPLQLDLPLEGLAASVVGVKESHWWTDEHQDQASSTPERFITCPRSSAEEAEFVRRALRESQEEANLQQAIRESLRQSPVTLETNDFQHTLEPADFQLANLGRSGLVGQRSAPCIASDVVDADICMASAQVPLAAWLTPSVSSPGDSMRTSVATPKALRWEQAVKRAARIAAGYVAVAVEAVTRAVKVPEAAGEATEELGRTFPTVPVVGSPPAPSEHLRVLELAMPTPGSGYPACWDAAVRGSGRPHSLGQSSEEFRAVVDYFHVTVGSPGLEVQEVVRLQNPRVYERCDSGPDLDTIMFHGCKSQANEDSIIAHGFQVQRCMSGGQNFGTWFAYYASYSNSGYAFRDQKQNLHLFVCVVSSKHVVLDNTTMRVVGQGCAYPLWLLKYKCPASSFSTAPALVPRKATTAFAPKGFHVVRDGAWVLE